MLRKYRVAISLVVAVVVLMVFTIVANYIITQNNQIQSSSAELLNQITLIKGDSGIENLITIDVGSNIATENVKNASLLFNFDPNSLECLEFDVGGNLIASNIKIDNSNGTVAFELSSSLDGDISGVKTLGAMKFIRKDTANNPFTNISLNQSSTVGDGLSLNPAVVQFVL